MENRKQETNLDWLDAIPNAYKIILTLILVFVAGYSFNLFLPNEEVKLSEFEQLQKLVNENTTNLTQIETEIEARRAIVAELEASALRVEGLMKGLTFEICALRSEMRGDPDSDECLSIFNPSIRLR